MYDALCPPTLYLLFMGPIVIICGDLVVVVCNQDFKIFESLESFIHWMKCLTRIETRILSMNLVTCCDGLICLVNILGT